MRVKGSPVKALTTTSPSKFSKGFALIPIVPSAVTVALLENQATVPVTDAAMDNVKIPSAGAKIFVFFIIRSLS